MKHIKALLSQWFDVEIGTITITHDCNAITYYVAGETRPRYLEGALHTMIVIETNAGINADKLAELDSLLKLISSHIYCDLTSVYTFQVFRKAGCVRARELHKAILMDIFDN